QRNELNAATADASIHDAVAQAMALLNSGKARVAEKIAGEWVVHQWLKKAVLLYFRLHDNQVMDGAESRFFDKVPLKYADYSAEQFAAEGVRVVPPATVRTGS
ncbi:2,3,4,5-tetrahydropyridine-2,6-dicarboxylate N-succinyltransferase, partial [Bowmanella dokdonensis]|nr:2,3,4,5-tetrahydropyridine-2,6-dicarboxylate N-succinyltransferase [Bowmanella dokdonensis]